MANAERPVWLCGGSEIAATSTDAGLVDRIVVKLNPVVFGADIPLFDSLGALVPITLEQTKRYDSGILTLTDRLASAQPSVQPEIR